MPLMKTKYTLKRLRRLLAHPPQSFCLSVLCVCVCLFVCLSDSQHDWKWVLAAAELQQEAITYNSKMSIERPQSCPRPEQQGCCAAWCWSHLKLVSPKQSFFRTICTLLRRCVPVHHVVSSTYTKVFPSKLTRLLKQWKRQNAFCVYAVAVS